MLRLFIGSLVVGCATGTPTKRPWPTPAEPPVPVLVSAGGRGGSLEESTSVEDDVEATEVGESEPGKLVFRWPIPMRAINSLFGYRVDPLEGSRRFHSGIDLDGAYGQVVGAAAPGRVVKAGWRLGHGRQVVIEHAGGFRSSYSHLAQVLVDEGSLLGDGQPLGMLGNSGRSTAPHLHFEISRHGEPLDPLDLLGVPVSVD
jgi:murein DD-endopeptidase MepM/ murein hydrolase activator NlpD